MDCKCALKEEAIITLSENIPFDDFPTELNKDNLIVVRCYNLVFNSRYLKMNYGSYIVIALFICEIITFVFFLYQRLKPLYTYLPQFPFQNNKERNTGESEEYNNNVIKRY